MQCYKFFTYQSIKIFLIFLSMIITSFPLASHDNETIELKETASPPVIDGKADDKCWKDIEWLPIDQVWIPYGATVATEDYSGRFKVAWSSTQNLIYFLVEIVDDVGVDGFVQNVTADVYHFDIIEVFIDENKSGGYHVFDGTSDSEQGLGVNAENAFSYHFYADFPAENSVITDKIVLDLDGKNWGNSRSVNYSEHFPEFAFTKEKNTYTREFSLIVYNDTYESNNIEAARVQLNAGKILGLSLAYCDNDGLNESPKTRDNFFGSVWVEAAAYNDHWKNADDYGTFKLVSVETKVQQRSIPKQSDLYIYPNPGINNFNIEIEDDYLGQFGIKIFNIIGQEIYNETGIKNIRILNQQIVTPDLPAGLYFFKLTLGQKKYNQKILISK